MKTGVRFTLDTVRLFVFFLVLISCFGINEEYSIIWALVEDELKTLQERAEFFGLDKTADLMISRQNMLNILIE